MLHTETVEPGTLSVLNQIMEIEALGHFSLVSGTALSLRFGHRTSVDLDLFSDQPFNNDLVINALGQQFGDRFSYRSNNSGFGVFGSIGDVKIDVIRYPHAQIAPTVVESGMRMYANSDIAAMKIQAILGPGKKKDFWDLCELFKHYTMEQVMAWHKQKYPTQMLAISIPQAITYFVDANESEEPVSLNGQTWETVKKSIQQTVNEYLR